jgi:hypothetical protein
MKTRISTRTQGSGHWRQGGLPGFGEEEDVGSYIWTNGVLTCRERRAEIENESRENQNGERICRGNVLGFQGRKEQSGGHCYICFSPNCRIKWFGCVLAVLNSHF